MKSKVLLVLFTILVTASLTAQDSKKKKKDKKGKAEKTVVDTVKEEVIMMTTDEPTEVMIESSEPRNTQFTAFEPIQNIRYNAKYEIYSNIDDQYDFYCDKYSRDKYNNMGIVDKSGNVILPHIFGKNYSYSNKTQIILYINSNYGLFNLAERQWTIPMEYEELSDLNNNLYAAKKSGRWGVIDNNNNVIVPFEWYQISNVSNLENYVMVSKGNYSNRLSGVYSLAEKKMVLPCIYSDLRKLDRFNYFLVTNGSKRNLVDINNTPLFKVWYDEIYSPSSGRNYFIVKTNNRFGVVDDNEKVIIPIEYLEFAQYPFSDGSYLAKNKDGKYGFILIDGRITMPFQYDNLTKNYYDNVLSVQNGKCGLVQVNSGLPYEIVTCDYDDIQGTSKTFIVEKGGKFGLLDIYGKSLTNIEYESIAPLDENSSENFIYKVKKDGLYKLINEQGKQIGAESYLDFDIIEKKNKSSYYYGQRFTYLKAKTKTGKYCIIDKVGKDITKPIFDDILSESDNMFIVKTKGKCGIYSLFDQKQVVDFIYDTIIKTNDNYLGITKSSIDILTIKSGQVKTVNTKK
jgi:hypothetical protein